MTPEEFKAWRKRMGWTQAEAGRQLGLSKEHILRLEKGVNSKNQKISPTRLHELSSKALENIPETQINEKK